MAAPTEDYINQAQDELMAVLLASPDFMAASAPDAPEGASGVIACVEDDLPEAKRIPSDKLPHCSVVYLEDGPVWEDSAASDTDYQITIGLRLYHRGTDRREVWRKLKRATAIVAKLIALEMSPTGTNFDGFATLARYEGGTAIDTEEDSGFGAMQLVRVTIQISLPDYEDTP